MSRRKRNTRETALKAEAEVYLRRLRARLSQRQSPGRLQRAIQTREEVAQKQAQSYLYLLTTKEKVRAALRARIEKRLKFQTAFLKRQAEAYRKRLRRYLSPAQMGETGGGSAPMVYTVAHEVFAGSTR